ncbi:MAG TPA: O-antigen ligase family protein [Solirubrobacteraceae bacterium]|nr:O-antigen ligase family protein [Solirubrobacteraceae bacterium]
MVAALALGRDLEKAGVIVVALLAATAVLAPTVRVRALAAGGALGLTPVLLIAEIWNTPQFRPLRERPALALVLAVAGLAAVAAGAWLITRRPGLLPVAAVAVLPFRIPIASGGDTANLLVPLYLVVAAGAVAVLVADLRGRPFLPAPRRPGWLEWVLLGFVSLYAVQAAYSSAFPKALEQVVFFYVPFALLFAMLVRYEWTSRRLAICLAVLTTLAVAFTCIGVVEYATRTLLLNPKVISANQFQSYFRVNSLFFDPNIFGRFLAVVMTLLAAVLLWERARSRILGVALCLAVLWVGLVLSLSQSSLAGLLVGLAVLGALRFGTRRAAAAVGAALAVGLVIVVAFPHTIRLNVNNLQSLNGSTSGRADLVRGGIDLFAARPLQGWGSGSFAHEFRVQKETSNERAAAASHTIPITVAAEQGIFGLALYVLLLIVALGRLGRGARGSPARAAILAAFAGLVVHTFLYAAFLEDPLVWALLAVGTALAAAGGTGSPQPAPGRSEPAPAATA